MVFTRTASSARSNHAKDTTRASSPRDAKSHEDKGSMTRMSESIPAMDGTNSSSSSELSDYLEYGKSEDEKYNTKTTLVAGSPATGSEHPDTASNDHSSTDGTQSSDSSANISDHERIGGQTPIGAGANEQDNTGFSKNELEAAIAASLEVSSPPRQPRKRSVPSRDTPANDGEMTRPKRVCTVQVAAGSSRSTDGKAEPARFTSSRRVNQLVGDRRSALGKTNFPSLVRDRDAFVHLQAHQQKELLLAFGKTETAATDILAAGAGTAHKALVACIVGNSALAADIGAWAEFLRDGSFEGWAREEMVVASEERARDVYGEDWEGSEDGEPEDGEDEFEDPWWRTDGVMI